MLKSLAAPPVHRRRMIALAATSLLVFTGVGTYLALTSDPRPSTQQGAVLDRGPASAAPLRDTGPGVLSPIPRSSDPEAFATAVATTLFEWDTMSMITQAEYVARLTAVADPTGEEVPGLVRDVANYLPTSPAWAALREYRTRQWLEVTSSTVPGLWPEAVAEAGPDGMLPGTTAYTIEGIRHRVGVWEGARVTSEHDVAFTVFIVCGPTYPTCRLLRLSLPDQPLG